ncbi:MAG: D-2-hydroxyacid dehydrogenase [Paludibacterium sp.]|uniref:D-2-hydroxyacid dehydrogenase n=1 Tax=Paludibacterium sp. TaxID=1917523 RepID=UPI0025DEF18E|nr:D-2-hydroxyacid dehydrogenase [Paludibacterium sp.]MBV8048917.1 D-2-hydroxyacid dehydrogenase [Paludibacterium sp.]MBV8649276.1 D-2-hydroxyacid dehydrogenase [Paludibacterium sp.]
MTVHIVFPDRDSLPVPLPEFLFSHRLTCFAETAPDELPARCADAEVLIVNKAPLSRALLQGLPRLKLIAVAATGVNNVDLAACRDLKIAVNNVRHYGDDTVAEHAFMLMLALSRGMPAYLDAVRAGAWSRSRQFCLYEAPVRDLGGACLVVVGSGGIGQALAARARAFGMTVLFAERKGVASPRPGYCRFEEGLARADVLSLHCLLTPETRGLIGRAELAAMKRGALLINTARGELVEETALLQALESGHLGGAGLDVLRVEPPPADAPLLSSALPNLIVTPHVAWASEQAMARLAAQVVDNVTAFLAGEARNRVV